MVENTNNLQHKISWYDGWLYSKFIDGLSGGKFNKAIQRMLPENCNVIEIGCGTGSLVFMLSKNCNKVVGVDTSPKMIDFAEKMRIKGSADNIEFKLIGKNSTLKEVVNSTFDYAVIKMVLHENDPPIRDHIIKNVKEIASKAIIADWVYPLPGGFTGFASNTIEFMAGKEHYANFKEWCSIGGLMEFLEKQGMKVIQEKDYKNKTGKIVKVEW